MRPKESHNAEVNGTKTKSLRSEGFKGVYNGRKAYGMRNPHGNKNECLVRILSDDFAAVDLREEPCHNGLSEKEKHGGKGKQRTERRAAEEQGDFASGSAQSPFTPPRVSLWGAVLREIRADYLFTSVLG